MPRLPDSPALRMTLPHPPGYATPGSQIDTDAGIARMPDDLMRYDLLAQNALKGVVREALRIAPANLRKTL